MKDAAVGPGEALANLRGGPWHFHVVGAGGAGMSAIARILLALGHTVSGSDAKASAALEQLARAGATVWVGHEAQHVRGADAVTFSTAVAEGNVELAQARRSGIALYRRSQVLAAICALERTVAVSGTHGKTTTTAMLATILAGAGVEASYLVGGDMPGGGGGATWADGELFVVEADESDGTFLELPAHAALVTSVEADHMDFFGDMACLEDAFWRFASSAPGPKVVCTSNPGSARLARRLGAEGVAGLVTYGEGEDARFRVVGARLEGLASSFELLEAGSPLGRFELRVPGMHNVLDAAGALAMAASLGVAAAHCAASLASFSGVGRRFERKGEARGIVFVDDYAHNPGKVAALLAAARSGGARRVVAVFQPHRYSRTLALGRELGESLAGADVVVVTGIYAAGEPAIAGVTGEVVANAARSAAPDRRVEYIPTRPELLDRLPAILQPGDLCLTIGAGDVTTLGPELIERLDPPHQGDEPCPPS